MISKKIYLYSIKLIVFNPKYLYSMKNIFTPYFYFYINYVMVSNMKSCCKLNQYPGHDDEICMR